MNGTKKQSNLPVFEMILDTAKSGSSIAQASPSEAVAKEDWHQEHHEGQLAVDVVEEKGDVVVISTMAGSDTSQIEVYIHNDLLTIRGNRDLPIDQSRVVNYFHEECFWGVFSRSVVLPVEVKADLARAEYKNGILVVRIPKQKSEAKIPVRIVEE